MVCRLTAIYLVLYSTWILKYKTSTCNDIFTYVGLPEVLIISSALMVEVTETIIFTAAVTGIGPFNYQWQKEGYNITNKTGSTFTIHNVSSSDQANYSCFISNDYGDSVVSNTIRLQVTST